MSRASVFALGMRGSTAALALIFAASNPTEAQLRLTADALAGQTLIYSDVTGPSVTTGDQLSPLFTDPGTVRTMECAVAWGVRTRADEIAGQLVAGRFVAVTSNPGSQLDAQVQRRVITLLTATRRERDATDEMAGILSAGQQPVAARAARRLVEDSRGLFNVVQAVDPLRPGPMSATRLHRAVGAYNTFVDVSSDAFLAQQPDELIALHAVLNSLVIASLENEGRVTSRTDVDERGLGCAALQPLVVTVIPPPVEQALVICVMLDRNFREVNALYRPATRDTMVLSSGQRLAFAEVYPDADRLTLTEWLVNRDAISIGGTQYIPFGLSRTVRPGELAYQGQAEGVDYFAQAGERSPATVVYFPVARSCEVQPYRAAETVRPRG
jgi:hypothetical protein